MLRFLALFALIGALASGCAVYDLPDLEMGVAYGQVVDKIPSVDPDLVKPVWFIDVEDDAGIVTRYPVTYRAFQAVDTGDMLPDDLLEPMPELERERTPWR